MTAKEAIAFVKRHRIILESARGPVPSLAAAVAGEPLRGNWWSHPKGKKIFHLSRAVRESADILVCRIVDGKVTYVHRRLWPAVVLLASRFPKWNLEAIREVHTEAGKHEVVVTRFPEWIPKRIVRAAHKLDERAAMLQLAAILKTKSRRAGSKEQIECRTSMKAVAKSKQQRAQRSTSNAQ